MSHRLVGQDEKLKVYIIGAEKAISEYKSISSVDDTGVYFVNSRGGEIFVPHSRISKIQYSTGATKKRKLSKGKKKKGKKSKK